MRVWWSTSPLSLSFVFSVTLLCDSRYFGLFSLVPTFWTFLYSFLAYFIVLVYVCIFRSHIPSRFLYVHVLDHFGIFIIIIIAFSSSSSFIYLFFIFGVFRDWIFIRLEIYLHRVSGSTWCIYMLFKKEKILLWDIWKKGGNREKPLPKVNQIFV